MKRKLVYLTLALSVIGSYALADDQVTTTQIDTGSERNGVFDAPLTLALDAGVMSIQQPGDAGQAADNLTRNNDFAGGLRLSWNLAAEKAIHIGLGTGLYASRPENQGVRSNFYLVPLNLELGTVIAGNFRLVGMAGANGVYRQNASSMALGRNDLTTDSRFDVFPDVGAMLGIGLGNVAGIEFRGNWTITPANDIFTATGGLVFAIS